MRNQDVPSGYTDRWTDRQADTHDEANRHFLHFAFVPKK